MHQSNIRALIDDLEDPARRRAASRVFLNTSIVNEVAARAVLDEVKDRKNGSDEVVKGLIQSKGIIIPRCECFESLDRVVAAMPALHDYVDKAKNYIDICKIAQFDNFFLNHLLLVGEPGTGKTHSAKRLAHAMGLECLEINLSEAQDGFFMTGTQKGYSNTVPGRIAARMAEAKTANPVIIIDELDKVSLNDADNRRGHLPTLLKILERSTSKEFTDLSLDLKIDISKVTFILTANNIDGMPDSLMSRIDVIDVPKQSGRQLAKISERILLEEINEIAGRHTGASVSLSEESHAYIEGFTPRDVKRAARDLLVSKLRENNCNIHMHFIGEDFLRVMGAPESTESVQFGFAP